MQIEVAAGKFYAIGFIRTQGARHSKIPSLHRHPGKIKINGGQTCRHPAIQGFHGKSLWQQRPLAVRSNLQGTVADDHLQTGKFRIGWLGQRGRQPINHDLRALQRNLADPNLTTEQGPPVRIHLGQGHDKRGFRAGKAGITQLQMRQGQPAPFQTIGLQRALQPGIYLDSHLRFERVKFHEPREQQSRTD